VTAAAAVAAVRGHLARRHEWYWAPAVYALALAIVYRAIVGPGEPAVGFGWDTIESYWGDLAYLADRVRHGDWPIWDVFEKLGYPDLAVPERGHHDPLNWPLAAVGAALGETPWWLIQLKILLHHLIAGVAMHGYLRRRGLPIAAALVGGLAWMTCAPLLIHKASSVIWPLAWLPLVWLAIDRAIARPDVRGGLLLGGALGLAGDAGSAPGFFYVLLAAAPYGALRLGTALIAARRAGGLGAAVRRHGAALALAAATTVALVAIWVVPAGELTALSQRAERSIGYATSFPLAPRATLLGLVAAPWAGGADAYVGLAAIALALAAIALAPRADGGVPLLAIATASLMLVLAFGAATPVLPWLAAHAPGFDLFRAANRFKLVAAPLLCVAAAHGAAALLALAARTRARRAAPWALAALAAAAVVDAPRVVFGKDPALERRPDEADRRWLAGLGDVAVEGALWDEFVIEQRPGPRLGVRELRGYPAGASLEYARYADVLAAIRRAPELLAAYGVRAVLWGRHHRIGTSAHLLARPPSETTPAWFAKVRDHVHAVRNPAPVAAWYGAARVVDGPPREVLAAVRATLAPDAPRRVVVLEPDGAAALGPALAPLVAAVATPPAAVPGRVAAQRAGRIVVEVDAPAAGIATLAHTFYPGWRVAVDGAPAIGFPVDRLVRGVAVGPGRHRIEWTFRPRGHGLRLLAWWAALIAVLCAALPPRARKRRPPAAPAAAA
jgi:hypothetical protein